MSREREGYIAKLEAELVELKQKQQTMRFNAINDTAKEFGYDINKLRAEKNQEIDQLQAKLSESEDAMQENVELRAELKVENASRKVLKNRLHELEKELERYRELPKIVTLCGSTRFTKEMLIKQWELTKQGIIVVSWCALPDDYYQGDDKTHIGDQEGVKEIVDELHKRKIDLSDSVFVLNVDGYIGESTRSEIEYAKNKGKKINYLEKEFEEGKE